MAELRPYQTEGIRRIFNCWKEGRRSVLFQMPTGTGKTVLFSQIVKLGFDNNRRILIVVHRKELVEQITEKLTARKVPVGHIVAGMKADYTQTVQVASIQTLSRREHPEANLIIIDECHHAKAETYKKLWDIYPDAKFLGVTATPVRLSGEGFDDLFDELIVSMPTQKFIEQGYLCPVTHLVCSNPNLSDVKQKQGDYITKMLSGVMMDNSIMSDLIESYKEKSMGKTAIVFAVDVEHSQSIVKRYNEENIFAAHIDATTPKSERASILNDFKAGKIKVVSNVEIITEGFDFPECEVVQLARPTKSLSLYLQMVGRVMRPSKNKKEGIILDNAGLWLEHGLSIVDREWSLQSTKKKNKNDLRQIKEVALDEDGTIREINRKRPLEIKGLKLIPLTFEIKRLFEFETILVNSRAKGYNLLSSYFAYKSLLEERNIAISKYEFEYIKKRLNAFNEKAPADKQFKKGYWYNEEKTLFQK
ncbi:MAG: DEAD/DEAH box helicase [Chitinophagaceae bacterium]|nr:DEAD/DEAH box helicase [Chitinophagaceae bacterium]